MQQYLTFNFAQFQFIGNVHVPYEMAVRRGRVKGRRRQGLRDLQVFQDVRGYGDEMVVI